MPIPDFQTPMRPILEILADGAMHATREIIDQIAVRFDVTPEERTEQLPSGRALLLNNRIGWALSHMKHAGLIESPRRAVYAITERGRAVLRTHPERVDMRTLKEFEEYRQFIGGNREEQPARAADRPGADGEADTLTPEEHIDRGYQMIREELAATLLAKIAACPPDFFEQLVVDLLLAMGYGGSRTDAGRAVGGSGDGGIDGIINEDKLGLDAIYVQAKRWQGVVGRPEVQKFAGALQGRRARKGIFLTTSTFTDDAKAFVSLIDSRIVLIDGVKLAELMIDHGVGVTTVQSYEIRRIDSDYFPDGEAGA